MSSASLHAAIEGELGRRFGGQDLIEARSLILDILKLPTVRDPESAARIQMAAIRFAGSSMERLRRAVKAAEIDWRDLLVASGLANADWQEVLERDGVEVPR